MIFYGFLVQKEFSLDNVSVRLAVVCNLLATHKIWNKFSQTQKGENESETSMTMYHRFIFSPHKNVLKGKLEWEESEKFRKKFLREHFLVSNFDRLNSFILWNNADLIS